MNDLTNHYSMILNEHVDLNNRVDGEKAHDEFHRKQDFWTFRFIDCITMY